MIGGLGARGHLQTRWRRLICTRGRHDKCILVSDAVWQDPSKHILLHNISHDDVIKWKIFRVTGPLWGEFTGHRWIPLTKASDAELWCFLWSGTEQTVEQTTETPLCSLWRHCNDRLKSACTSHNFNYLWPLLLTWFNFNPSMDK